ncbi:flagellar hook-length control protein FliK, partial [Azospirillum sp.]|uniref:flagellar hook-length control protein FliK n=1 Tax=Azospirillum sp. TaxID=34012 RepID=UPI002D430C1C
MDILSSAPLSLLDQLAPNTAGQTAGKDDEFAKMMNRLMSDAMERKREEQRAAQAERPRAPARSAAKPQPPRADDSSPSPRAAEAHGANGARALDRAGDRTTDRAETKDPAVRDAGRENGDAARKTEAKATADKADAADRTAQTAKANQPAGTDKAATDTTDAANAGGEPADTGEDAAAQAAEATDGAAESAEAATAGNGDELVVIEAEVTITETTVQIITEDSELTMTALSGLAQVQVEGFEGEITAEAADPLTVGTATAGGQGPAAPATPEEMLKAALNAAGEVTAGEAGGEAAKAAGTQAAAADGAARGEALPTDEEFKLPDDMADLVAVIDERKRAEKSANTGNGDAGTQGEGQPQGQAQPNTQPAAQAAQATVAKPDAAEALKSAAAAAEATAAAVDATAAAGSTGRTEHTAADLNHAALAGLDAAKGPAGVDAPQPLATLRPSRGAHMPMGVPDQLAVHVQKNVREGNDQFTINLRPDELGRIEIKLEFQQEGRVQVVIAVDKPQTLELLQRDARSLEKALQDAGVKADSGSLSFSLRGDGNPFAGEGG